MSQELVTLDGKGPGDSGSWRIPGCRSCWLRVPGRVHAGAPGAFS